MSITTEGRCTFVHCKFTVQCRCLLAMLSPFFWRLRFPSDSS